ncbi:EF-Tu/IF-2/RF-3 family GTPase [Streptomyces sp. NPDC049040]|uniref:EF-Tu C-terminal domain-related protein n=1 Tax=Streptomyces sp. NPDC049040 TaxID=3365593 RepID=UPI0037187B4E
MEPPFLLVVEDVFDRDRGRAVLAAGRIERGRVRPGDVVEVVGQGGPAALPVTAVDSGGGRIREASAGMNIGLLLPGTGARPERGDVLATPGSVAAWRSFTAEIAVLPQDQGGAGIRTGDRAAFHIHAAAVPGTVRLPDGAAVLRPSHGATVTVTLDHPVALEEGRRFAFRYRGRATGSGTVTRLLGTGP